MVDEDGAETVVHALNDETREAILEAQFRLLIGFLGARNAHISTWGFVVNKKPPVKVGNFWRAPYRVTASWFC